MSATFAGEFAVGGEALPGLDEGNMTDEQIASLLADEAPVPGTVQTPNNAGETSFASGSDTGDSQRVLGEATAEDKVADAVVDRLRQTQVVPDRNLPQTEPESGLSPNVASRLVELFPSQAPAKVETPEEIASYALYRTGQSVSALVTDINNGATIQQSETDARQVFSADKVAEGFDYDSVIKEYVEPTLQTNPAFRDALGNTENPGHMMYFMGLAAKLSDKYGGNPAKAAHHMATALQTPVEAAADIVKMATVANSQMQVPATESGKTATTLMDQLEQVIDTGDDAAFMRMDAALERISQQ